jgi:hypothetical protein
VLAAGISKLVELPRCLSSVACYFTNNMPTNITIVLGMMLSNQTGRSLIISFVSSTSVIVQTLELIGSFAVLMVALSKHL